MATVVFSMFTGGLIYQLLYQDQLDDSQQNQKELISSVALQASVGIFANNETILNDVSEGLLSSTFIEGVRLLNNEKIVLTRPENNGDFDSADRYPLYSPINASQKIGSIEILVNQRLITEKARKKAWIFTLIAVTPTFLMVFFVILALRLYLLRPLTYLANSIARIEPGSGDRLDIGKSHEGDELDVLTECTNDFLGATEAALNNERAIRQKIEEIQKQYKRILDTTRISFFVLNKHEELVNYNNALEMLVEKSLLKSIDDIKDVFSDKFFHLHERFWEMTLEAIQSRNTVSGKLQLATHNNKILWVQCIITVVYRFDGELEFIEGVMFDVTDELQKLEESRQLAQIDNLTKLQNRHGFDLAFDKLLTRASEDDQVMVVMMLDLDEFKPINDTYGHAEGDHVLTEVAARISSPMHRSSDLAARIGGDEFVIAFPFPGAGYRAFAKKLARELLDSISAPITLKKHQQDVTVSVSIGIACYPDGGLNQQEVMEAADKAMYSVKNSGKSGFAFFAE